MYTKCECANNLNKQSSIMITEDFDYGFTNELHYNPSLDDYTSVTVIDGRTFQNGLIIRDVDRLFRICIKRWRQVEDAVFGEGSFQNVDVSEARKQIVNILSRCRYSMYCYPKNVKQQTSLQNNLWKQVRLFQNIITPWSEFEAASLLKLSTSSITDGTNPIYHYFHMYIDVQWILLSLRCACDAPLESYEKIIKDLIVFSYEFYKKQQSKEITQLHAFVCPCIKRLWVSLQFLSDAYPHKIFWEIFNDLMKDSDEEFSIWLLHSVAMLQGYGEDGKFKGLVNPRILKNQVLIDQKLKSLTDKPTYISNNQKLLNCCKLINELLNEWWTEDIQPESYEILLKIFSKRINLCFNTNTIDSAAERIQRLEEIATCSNIVDSFEYFLYMLNKYALKFPDHWSTICDRIYYDLPPHGIDASTSELTVTGLHNVSLLFLSLLRTAHRNRISAKLIILLLKMEAAHLNNRQMIINIYMTFMILCIRRGFGIKGISRGLVSLAQKYSSNQGMFHLTHSYVNGLDAVLNASEDFNLDQYLLLHGSWVRRYITQCQYIDLCYFLNMLLRNIERTKNTSDWNGWMMVFRGLILPALKTVATKEDAPVQVGKLAASIAADPTSEWVLKFTADPVSPKVVCHFISTLLEGARPNLVLPEGHEKAILHAWTRCCLLNCEDKEKLTRNVMKIRSLSSVVIQIDCADNPLISFSKRLRRATTDLGTITKLCEKCFGHVDSWIVNPYLKSPQSESLIVHIYTCIGLLVRRCSYVLYQRARSSCMLNKLINIFLLSEDVMVGKNPHPYVLDAVQRTWHLFVQGIYAVYSLGSNDYLERILRYMVIRYVPLLSLTNCPILKCTTDMRLFTLLLEKLSGTFLSHNCISSNSNTTKAFKIVTLAIENSNSVENTKLILNCTLTSILELVMDHVHESAAIDFIKFVVSRENYSELKECTNCSLLKITVTQLTFNANNYFQFLNILANIIPNDIRTILPNIEKRIGDLELIRNVGYANSLSHSLYKLERLLGFYQQE